jgi:hypothetical protein
MVAFAVRGGSGRAAAGAFGPAGGPGRGGASGALLAAAVDAGAGGGRGGTGAGAGPPLAVFVTTNECPHFGHRIFKPVGGTRRSSIWYGALHDSHSTLSISAGE